jgi:drug/metabolite transporter (DMT)-like permease
MAAYLVLGRSLGKQMDVWAFSGIATGVGAALLLGSAVVLGVSPVPPSLGAFGYLVLAALVPQLIGHSLLTWSLRHARPTVVGISTVGEPVGSTLLGLFWLGEQVPWVVALGCAVTLGAVVVALLGAPRAPSPSEAVR